MYTKSNKIFSDKAELANYIEDTDVYNSSLLKKLNDPGIPKESYIIGTHIFRPDLIAKDFYGDENYQCYVILQCSYLSSLTFGSVIYLISKEYLLNIINSL